MNVGAIILAAGGSRRMGRAKQLLTYEGKTLLVRAVDAALGAGCAPVVVVTGCSAERMAEELAGRDVIQVVNGDWEKGMGASIRRGVEAMGRQTVDGAVVMLCDQPRVGPEALRRLIEAADGSRMPVVAAEYGATAGPPCFFVRELFPELSVLPDPAGGKAAILRDPSRVRLVPMEEAATDVDTPGDWRRMNEVP